MKMFNRSLLLLFISLSVISAVNVDELGGPKVGEDAPLFSVKSLMYENFTLYNKTKEIKENNGILVLDFWATWCVPCKKEFPIFESIYKELEEKGVEFYAVAIDSKRADVWNYVKNEAKVTFPVLFDQNAFQAGKNYGANELLPQLFIIDSDRVVRARHIGEVKNLEAVLKHEIEMIKPGTFPDYKDIKVEMGEAAENTNK